MCMLGTNVQFKILCRLEFLWKNQLLTFFKNWKNTSLLFSTHVLSLQKTKIAEPATIITENCNYIYISWAIYSQNLSTSQAYH